MPTNDERALRADITLTFYMELSHGEKDSPKSQQKAIIDLLTDLRHFCNHWGTDFDKAIDFSLIHFEMDVEESNAANNRK